MTADYQTLDRLWEQYDERPSRLLAIRVTLENLVEIAEALTARGIRATVDFTDQTISFDDGDKKLTAQAHRDYITTITGGGFGVMPGSILRGGWRKFMDGDDW